MPLDFTRTLTLYSFYRSSKNKAALVKNLFSQKYQITKNFNFTNNFSRHFIVYLIFTTSWIHL